MAAVQENDIRLLRQALYARESGRNADAEVIASYVSHQRDVPIDFVTRREVAGAWLEYWGVPASVEEMFVLLGHGKEPIYRIPAGHAGTPRPLSEFEIPFVVPDELRPYCTFDDTPALIEVSPIPQRVSLIKRLFG